MSLKSNLSVFLLLTAILPCAFVSASAQEGAPAKSDKASIPTLPQSTDSYDPSLTAKEAALTNWTLAVSGIRAGKVVSGNVIATAAEDSSFEALAEQAQFAVKTMVIRYNSANWLFAAESDVSPMDTDILLSAIKAANQTCNSGECKAEREAIAKAFTNASDAFDRAAKAAASAAKAHEAHGDAHLMALSLENMAHYLEGPAWYSNLSLTEMGKDGEEVAARLVGALAIWHNIEAYVGMANQEIDGAINASIDLLLRDMRRNTRNKPVLEADSKEIARLRKSAAALADNLHRAAALFEG